MPFSCGASAPCLHSTHTGSRPSGKLPRGPEASPSGDAREHVSLQIKKPPWGGFFSSFGDSALGELLAPPRLVQSHLLALDFARVARDEPCLAQHRLQRRVELDERPGQSVAHCSRLPEFTA